VRTLSPSEARVVQVLLAGLTGDEKDRIAAAGVPRSTYHKIRRKALALGWLAPRYVPRPPVLGVRVVSVAFAQPFAEHWAEAVARWRLAPGTVVLWATPGSLFAVGFRAARAGPEDPAGLPPPWARRLSIVEAEASAVGVPVYFDFEGAWSRYTGALRPLTYPVPVAPPFDGTGDEGRREALAEARSTSARRLHAIRPNSLGPETDLPDAERRSLSEGWVIRRAFPDLSRIPPRRAGELRTIILLTGRWRSGGGPTDLLERIVQGSGSSPFFLARDPQRLIAGFLAGSAADPALGAGPLGRVLSDFLVDIEVERAPIGTVVPVLDHAYERLAAG
jgi:hypothetical protein